MSHENVPEGLDETELGNVSGGCYIVSPRETGYVRDNQGRSCGVYVDGVLKYWPCPKCGRPTHNSWGVYHCDPCNDWFFYRRKVIWTGTAAELSAAGSN